VAAPGADRSTLMTSLKALTGLAELPLWLATPRCCTRKPSEQAKNRSSGVKKTPSAIGASLRRESPSVLTDRRIILCVVRRNEEINHDSSTQRPAFPVVSRLGIALAPIACGDGDDNNDGSVNHSDARLIVGSDERCPALVRCPSPRGSCTRSSRYPMARVDAPAALVTASSRAAPEGEARGGASRARRRAEVKPGLAVTNRNKPGASSSARVRP
jgi:hypothetical protein